MMWFELGAILVLTRFRYFRQTGLWQHLEGPNWPQMRRILKIGIPIGLSTFVGMVLFTVVSFLVGSLGVTAIAAHDRGWPHQLGDVRHSDVARHRRPAFVSAFALALATTAARRRWRAPPSCYRSATPWWSACWWCCCVTKWSAIYSDDAAVTSLAATLLFIVRDLPSVRRYQGTMAGALRGYKDTRAPMVYSMLGYWVLALPLGAALAFGWWRLPALGVYGFWLALLLGLAAVATAMAVRPLQHQPQSAAHRHVVALRSLRRRNGAAQ